MNGFELQSIEGTAHRLQALDGYMQITSVGANVGMAEHHLNGAEVSTSVEQYQNGCWRVKVHYLTAAGWNLIASDLWGEDDEDESDRWKEQP